MFAHDDQFQSFQPAVRGDAIVRHYGNELVAWSPIGPQPTALDPVAALLYQLFDGSASIADLVADVHEAVGVPPAVAANQVRRVVEQLDGARLLSTSRATILTLDEFDLFPAPLNP